MSYNILTGNQRSGTSMLMLALKEAGVPIIGFKYPITTTYKNEKTGETKKVDSGELTAGHKLIQGNPNGYWEVSSILEKGLQKEHKEIGRKGNLVKVMLDLLPISDIMMIDKAVVVLRNPRKILTSYFKCRQAEPTEIDIRIISLSLAYNLATSIKYLQENKKDILITYYEEVLKNPAEELDRICLFLGRNCHENGVKVIKKGLDRSEEVKLNCKEIKLAEELYRNPYKKVNTAELYKKIIELNAKTN